MIELNTKERTISFPNPCVSQALAASPDEIYLISLQTGQLIDGVVFATFLRPARACVLALYSFNRDKGSKLFRAMGNSYHTKHCVFVHNSHKYKC